MSTTRYSSDVHLDLQTVVCETVTAPMLPLIRLPKDEGKPSLLYCSTSIEPIRSLLSDKPVSLNVEVEDVLDARPRT